jgi:hypothetical protein
MVEVSAPPSAMAKALRAQLSSILSALGVVGFKLQLLQEYVLFSAHQVEIKKTWRIKKIRSAWY